MPPQNAFQDIAYSQHIKEVKMLVLLLADGDM